MGGSSSTLFPTEVLKCEDSIVDDARYDYYCTASEQIRSALTIIHLLVMVAVFLVAMLLYVIYLRVMERRYDRRVQALSQGSVPFLATETSSWMYKRIIATYTMSVADELLSKPPSSDADSGVNAWGVVGDDRKMIKYRDEIIQDGRALQLLFHSALYQLNARIAANQPVSLRKLAPDIVKIFGIDPNDLRDVVNVFEEAELLQHEFTDAAYQDFRDKVESIQLMYMERAPTAFERGPVALRSPQVVTSPTMAMRTPSPVKSSTAKMDSFQLWSTHNVATSSVIEASAVTQPSADSIIGHAAAVVTSLPAQPMEEPAHTIPSARTTRHSTSHSQSDEFFDAED